MATLKELRNKIGVIESTRKVTSAMKLVAGVKLRKSEQKAEASQEYAVTLNNMLAKIRREFIDVESELFFGRKNVKTELLVVFSSDRGLCGNFNYLVGKKTMQIVHNLHQSGKNVRIICVGNKIREILKKFSEHFEKIDKIDDFYRIGDTYENSKKLAERVIHEFSVGEVDKVDLIYTHYYSAMNHDVLLKEMIPLSCEPNNDKTDTVFEPNVEKVLSDLLPFNIGIQIYQAALESIASEQSSRMTSMDNATRNADNLLSEFKMKYNRMRQAKITLELVEVISGAKAIAKE
ncbi:MAG: ATP synthase F1 subunit gamma [Alphaproteobacteria bacterium]|nr:ATP synthase F1 subunit gamma [Alphaproteobacteria bacterium]